jgi:hypothetical protein
MFCLPGVRRKGDHKLYITVQVTIHNYAEADDTTLNSPSQCEHNTQLAERVLTQQLITLKERCVIKDAQTNTIVSDDRRAQQCYEYLGVAMSDLVALFTGLERVVRVVSAIRVIRIFVSAQVICWVICGF